MKIILQIHNNTHFTWTQLNDSNEIVVQHAYQELADIPAVLKGAYLIVLIPGQEVLTTRAKIPKATHHELMKAIPYALEEQLISEIEKLYFAIGDYDEDKNLSIAVINKQKFEAYLDNLKKNHLYPDVLLPDYLAIPFQEGCWSIFVTTDIALVRIDPQLGFATELENLPVLLDLTCDRINKIPTKIKLYDPLERYSVKNLSIVRDRINVETIKNIKTFAFEELIKQAPMNLLQWKYQSRNKSPKLKRYWKLSMVFFAGWLVFSLGSLTLQLYYLNHQEQKLHRNISGLYKQIFPKSKAAIEPRFRIQNELKQLSQFNNNNHFINLLNHIGVVLQQYSTVHLQSFTYQSNQITLNLEVPEMAQLEAVTNALEKRQLKVKQNQVHSAGKILLAKVTVK